MTSWHNLPSSVKSRTLKINGLNMRFFEVLSPQQEAGSSKADHGLLVLLHGFPELAYSWRKVMVPLAEAGYHVVAPDQRGYGQTRLCDQEDKIRVQYEDDVAPYRLMNLTTDIVAFVHGLGYDSVEAVIGHDCGSRPAGCCALLRPDLFKSVVLMSAPFTGISTAQKTSAKPDILQLEEQLATLNPPRKHYTVYYSTPAANDDMSKPPQGLKDFLRAYYHVKSADWKMNDPHPLSSKDVSSFAKLPYYYVMPLNDTMHQSVGRDEPTSDEVSRNKWLTEEELDVYVSVYGKTGFQGGLMWYRCMTDPGRWADDLRVFAGKKIEIPAMFIAGKSDWGTYQYPGAVEEMRDNLCTKMPTENFVLVEGAGHWVQQEQPEEVVKHLLRFLASNRK